MRRRAFLLASMLADCAWSEGLGAVPAKTQRLNVFTTEYPPYASTQLPGQGGAVQMLRELLAPTAYEPNVVFRPWARLGIEIQQGAVDLVLLAWPGDIEQHRLLASLPWFSSRLGLYVRREDWRADGLGLAALRGREVAGVRDYAYPPQVHAAGMVVKPGLSDELNLRMLALRRHDLVLLERAVGRFLLTQLKLTPRGDSREPLWQEPALAELPMLVGVVPGRPYSQHLLSLLDRQLRDYVRSGRYQRLISRHGFDASDPGALMN
jgi:polar amino acid transport system substrate-binding protein